MAIVDGGGGAGGADGADGADGGCGARGSGVGADGDVEELVVRAPVEGLEAGTTTSAMRSTWVWSWREGGECIAVFGDRWIPWELVEEPEPVTTTSAMRSRWLRELGGR